MQRKEKREEQTKPRRRQALARTTRLASPRLFPAKRYLHFAHLVDGDAASVIGDTEIRQLCRRRKRRIRHVVHKERMQFGRCAQRPRGGQQTRQVRQQCDARTIDRQLAHLGRTSGDWREHADEVGRNAGCAEHGCALVREQGRVERKERLVECEQGATVGAGGRVGQLAEGGR